MTFCKRLLTALYQSVGFVFFGGHFDQELFQTGPQTPSISADRKIQNGRQRKQIPRINKVSNVYLNTI